MKEIEGMEVADKHTSCAGCQMACICVAYEDLGGGSCHNSDPDFWNKQKDMPSFAKG